eukprot:3272201-Prymnesium_polylepis.2
MPHLGRADDSVASEVRHGRLDSPRAAAQRPCHLRLAPPLVLDQLDHQRSLVLREGLAVLWAAAEGWRHVTGHRQASMSPSA